MKSRFPLAKRAAEFSGRMHGANVSLNAVGTNDVWSPNMTGKLKTYPGEVMEKSGVFLDSNKEDAIASQNSGPSQGHVSIIFNAADGNALYSGDQLQASALQVLACIKV